MQRVAAKLAVEILVSFKQHNIDAASRQQQRQDHARRPATDDAAGRFLCVDQLDVVVSRLLPRRRYFIAQGLIRSFVGRTSMKTFCLSVDLNSVGRIPGDVAKQISKRSFWN